MVIKIFTTGGSLDKAYSTRESAFLVQEPQIESVLHEANVSFDYEIEPLFRKDSLELTDEDRKLIVETVNRDRAERILITHGTDTMAHTGQRLGEVKGKTIVLTGAMQPASFKHSDAHFNIGFALALLQTLPHGVYIAMNGPGSRSPHQFGRTWIWIGSRFEQNLFVASLLFAPSYDPPWKPFQAGGSTPRMCLTKKSLRFLTPNEPPDPWSAPGTTMKSKSFPASMRAFTTCMVEDGSTLVSISGTRRKSFP